ncbi:hypothetical protein [Succinimonas amylolytica]|uniref:hypothetical protein n=1 Tax=Succinimonas amylolytica TaxID=83769 RepID=UPI000363EA6C|nr:hypothetical protein [Succinimonas amylolytica]
MDELDLNVLLIRHDFRKIDLYDFSEILTLDNIKIEKKQFNYNGYRFTGVKFKSCYHYMLKISDLNIDDKYDNFSIGVYDIIKDRMISCVNQKSCKDGILISIIFGNIPNNIEPNICIYNGLFGRTRNRSLDIVNVSLYCKPLLLNNFSCYYDIFDETRSLINDYQFNKAFENLIFLNKKVKNVADLGVKQQLIDLQYYYDSSRSKRFIIRFEKKCSFATHLDDVISSASELVNYSLNIDVSFCKSKILTVTFLYKNNKTDRIVHESIGNSIELQLNLIEVSRIGVDFDNQFFWLYDILLSPINNVLIGREGWLFLTNDTNNSIGQYTGKILIDNQNIDSWKKYLVDFSTIPSKSIFLLAPSKESVFPEYYPYPKSDFRSTDQILKIINDYDITCLYPVEILRSYKNSYCKTDTHWSYPAAMKVCNTLLSLLNFKHSVDCLNVKNIRHPGDLGSKIHPPYYSEFEIIPGPWGCTMAAPVFTNFIYSRQGMVNVYQNESAKTTMKVVVFGDSFSYILVPYLYTVFKKLVFVHSNSVVMRDIIDYEKPDLVISEMCERFCLRSPLFLNHIIEYGPASKPIIQKDVPDIQKYIEQNLDISSPYYLYMKDRLSINITDSII